MFCFFFFFFFLHFTTIAWHPRPQSKEALATPGHQCAHLEYSLAFLSRYIFPYNVHAPARIYSCPSGQHPHTLNMITTIERRKCECTILTARLATVHIRQLSPRP
uniref:Putative secreted protein n=1 Tax=Rhipicephalus microplus TaxID=6941 RepID=A0A6M2D9Q1_RHIMP